MNCEELQHQFVSYLLGELPPDKALLIEAHLCSSCSNCHEEFEAIREALGLVFAAVPVATLPAEQRQRIAQQALRNSPPVTGHATTWSAAPHAAAPNQGEELPAKLLKSLLAIAAGFFLMVGWQAVTSKQQPSVLSQHNSPSDGITSTHSTQALSGDSVLLPGSNEHVHYVSLKMQSAQATVRGYYLADGFSGQSHIVGNINRKPLIGEQFRLTVVTDAGETEIPIVVGDSGRFMTILPTPEGVIRDLLLQVSMAGN